MTVDIQTDVGDIELPSDVAETFRRVGDVENAPETLREGMIGFFDDDASITLEDLYQSERTRHAVRFGDTVEHVPCVGDAMIVALTRDERPVDIYSTPPGGEETVEFRVTETDVEVSPDSAVASVGIPDDGETDPAAVEATLNEESAVPAGCRLINAFPDPAAYERWAADVSDAAVMRLDVEEFVAVTREAAQFVDAPPELGEEIATRLATAFDLERPPETFADAGDEMVATLQESLDRPLGPEDLCTTDDSPHEARVGDRTVRYQCVLDAFILGLLVDDPVTVHTVCWTTDAEVTVEFDGARWSVASAPEDAVMSYGIERAASRPEGDLTPQKLYGQLCGYSHFFASRENYEAWDRTTPEAVTDAWPLAEGIEVARQMVGSFESRDRTAAETGGEWDCC